MATPVTTAYSTRTMTPVKRDSVWELQTTACGAPQRRKLFRSMRYNVSCIPLGSCLVGGKCNPETGRCTYEKLADESPCDLHVFLQLHWRPGDDGREYTTQDKCEDGLCVGRGHKQVAAAPAIAR